jgi:hypothetical protein
MSLCNYFNRIDYGVKGPKHAAEKQQAVTIFSLNKTCFVTFNSCDVIKRCAALSGCSCGSNSDIQSRKQA